jgi:PKD repeat protein
MIVMRRQYSYFLICLFIISMIGSLSLQGQNYSGYNWYFGNSPLGIRFGRGSNLASLYTNQATPFGNGGGAVASDPISGNVLFYSDGSRVYDVTGAQMPNGFGLNVNTSGNQSVVVTAVPGQPGHYYIITNTADYTTGGVIAATMVDMTLLGNATSPTPALGNVVSPKNIPIPGLNNRSEAMTLIPHANGTDYWLVSHEEGTNNYAVTLIDGSGTFSTTFYNGVGFAMVAANFSYNAAAGEIAVSPQSANVDVHLLNFDNSTGVLTFDKTIPNTAVSSTTDQAINDVEWSLNGQYLYISVAGEPGIQADVLQYDLLNPTTTLTSVLPQPNSIAQSYGLQIGPDSTIYHLYQATVGGPFLLGALTNTDSVATAVNYNPSAFPGNFNGTQFPSFLPRMDQNIMVNFTTSGTCSGVATSFFPTVSPSADSLVWDFGDGMGSSDWSPNYAYQNGGTYNVTLTAYLNGQSQSVTLPVTITQFDLQLTLVQDTTACRDEFPPPRGTGSPQPFSVTAQVQGGSPISETWSNGDTGLTLTPDSAGYYYLVVDDATGCAAYAGVNVREYGLQDQRANVWYFGQNAGIDFNSLPNPPVAVTGPVTSPEGTATISDRNGQVVFSTDGIHIYDKNNVDITPAPNPPGLGGDPGATQSVLIMPVPGDETLYYIFTTQEVYGTGTYELRYSLFDIKLNGGSGGLVEYNVLLFEPSTERITGSGGWLIAHEYGNNSFRAYQISANGIGNPVISGVGSDHAVTSPENGQGYMKLGPGNKLAVALSTPGTSNVVEIFDFNDSTGMVTNPRVADLNSATGQVYGVEFSPGGNKLFATLKDSPSKIYEFAFDSLGNVYLKQSVSETEELGALQMGPDGQIYTAVNGQNFLYTIFANEDTTMLTPLNSLQMFALAGGSQSTLGLPNFIQNISSPIQGPTIAASGTCLGTPTDFDATGRDPNIEYFQWTFGDGGGTALSTDPTAQHTYASAGTYNVSVRLTNRCDMDTVLFTTVVITPPPADPTFLQPGQFPVLCTGNLALEATPASNPDLSNLSFIWSTGDTTRTIVADQQATYSVTIVDNFGCSSNGAILIADNRPIVALGPDLTLCQNTPVFPLDAQNPGATYQWEVNGVNSGTAQTQSVDTSVPGMFEYKVEVTDPVTSCSVRDSLTYTINQSPVFIATPFNTSGCGNDDGSVQIDITDPATSLFTYSVVGPSPATTQIDQPIGSYSTPATLMPGTYGVTVSDQISGCYTITTVGINDNAFNISAVVRQNTCEPLVLTVTHTALVAGTYRVIDATTSQEVIPPTAAPIGSFNTPASPGLPSGNYIVEITAGGCTQISNPPYQFTSDPLVQVTSFTADGCSDPVTLSVVTNAANPTYLWTGPNITGGSSTASITATPPQGLQNYSVNVTDPALCPVDFPIQVDVDNTINAALVQGDACSDQVTLTATPSGPYLYRWYRNGVLDNGLAGTQAIATPANNGEQYLVQVFNPASGCSDDSPPLNVSVVGLLDLTLASTPACEGDQFTITATPNQSVSSYQWSFEGGVINGETSATLQDTRAGNFEALISQSGCTATQDIDVVLASKTPGNLKSHATICNDPANTDPNTNQVLLDPGSGFTSYAWSKDGVNLGITDPTLLVTEEGTYTVDLMNPVGCNTVDQTVVNIECLPKIVGPNAFRPEGLNRDFFLYTFFIDDTDFEVFIFSRWGELVFESTSREFRWNGGYNNSTAKPLPPGTYSYLVKYKSSYQPERGILEKRGGVVLLR